MVSRGVWEAKGRGCSPWQAALEAAAAGLASGSVRNSVNPEASPGVPEFVPQTSAIAIAGLPILALGLGRFESSATDATGACSPINYPLCCDWFSLHPVTVTSMPVCLMLLYFVHVRDALRVSRNGQVVDIFPCFCHASTAVNLWQELGVTPARPEKMPLWQKARAFFALRFQVIRFWDIVSSATSPFSRRGSSPDSLDPRLHQGAKPGKERPSSGLRSGAQVVVLDRSEFRHRSLGERD